VNNILHFRAWLVAWWKIITLGTEAFILNVGAHTYANNILHFRAWLVAWRQFITSISS